MRAPTLADLHVRKWSTTVEEVVATESGRLADGDPVRRVVIAAVLENPHAGEFGADLNGLVASSQALGEEFARRLGEHVGERAFESHGKGCIVGTAGEYEHGNALLTNVFADPLRLVLDGATSWMPSTGKRSGAGSSLDLPLSHKHENYVRSHYDTVTTSIADAPAPHEIVVFVVVADRGRLHARLGGVSAAEVEARD